MHAVTPEQVDAFFVMMAHKFIASLMIGAAVTLFIAAFRKPVHALASGIVVFSALTIYLNGWLYFKIYFFHDMENFPRRAGQVAAVLLAAVAVGFGLNEIWRRFRGTTGY